MQTTISSSPIAPAELAGRDPEAFLNDLIRFAELPRVEEWAARMWRTSGSQRWFLRQFAATLSEQGVMFKARGEWFVRRSEFPRAVAQLLTSGQLEAEALSASRKVTANAE